MANLGQELRDHHDAIVQRWYERWRSSSHPHHELAEAALKNSLALQLELIGKQLRDLDTAEPPEHIWKVAERLQPEERVAQDMPIEDVVQEYALATDVVRGWIEERRIEVSFREYTYFHRAMFELTAEAVRRYTSRSSDRTRGERARYLAAVMHQLRTPISALTMQVELLDRADGRASAETLQRLRRNVRRIQQLVDGILRLERFESWEVPVHPQDVRPARLIDDIVADHEAMAAGKRLRFEAHVNRSLQMCIDPDLFLDSLGNLVHNAIKYTPEGYVIVDAVEDSDGVSFFVRTGVGRARATPAVRASPTGQWGRHGDRAPDRAACRARAGWRRASRERARQGLGVLAAAAESRGGSRLTPRT